MRSGLAGATGSRRDVVPLTSTSRRTTLDARTMKQPQWCASTARADRSSTRSPAESIKLTADRSSSVVTPSARAASSVELRRSAVLRSSSPLARMRQASSSGSIVTLRRPGELTQTSSSCSSDFSFHSVRSGHSPLPVRDDSPVPCVTRRDRLGRWCAVRAVLGSGRDPEQFDCQIPLRLELEGVMEHGSIG
jgi:hypothetical protein